MFLLEPFTGVCISKRGQGHSTCVGGVQAKGAQPSL